MENGEGSKKVLDGEKNKALFKLDYEMKEIFLQVNGLKALKNEKMDARRIKADDIDTKNPENVAVAIAGKDFAGVDKDLKLEGLHVISNDSESDSVVLLSDDSDVEETSLSGNDDDMISEAPLTDPEIEELVTEFLETESKAAEAQESLEKESLAQVEKDVREELSQNLHGDALDLAVSTEMQTFREEWMAVLDDLETKSALLLEQLDGAGIELPALYKWIESQAPNGCCTEAWKKRIHWAGSQVSNEASLSVREAEEYLQSRHPVIKQHGRLLEVGASGFLARKFSGGDKNDMADWNSFNELIQSQRCSEGTSFGSENWASVYLANTPQQAASLGLNFPGVDEVEEIGEIDFDSRDPFYSDAIANEKEIDLTEEQKKNFRKVREDDDASFTNKLQQRLKWQRRKRKRCRVSVDTDALTDFSSNEDPQLDSVLKIHSENGFVDVNDGDISAKPIGNSMDITNISESATHNFNGDCNRSPDNKEFERKNKCCKTVFLESDEDVLLTENTVTPSVDGADNTDLHSPKQVKTIDVIDIDNEPSPDRGNCKTFVKEFQCTACYDILKAPLADRHPLLGVAVCRPCKSFIEEKMQVKGTVSSEFCAWCGKCDDLVNCNTCKMLFCETCISMNFGEEKLSEAKAINWRCYCCLPILLHRLIIDCDKALGVLPASSSDSDSAFSDADIDVSISKRRKKKIRRILDDTELGEETKEKIAIEKARQEYLKSMQVQLAKKSYGKTLEEINRSTSATETIRMLDDPGEGYVVNVAREDDEDPVRIAPSLSMKLKPHQVEGIRFMWENIIQSVRKVKSGDKGLGCILAHTMGLGKTFQVIAFLYTAMRSVDLGLRTALIVTPVNVLHNWKQEFLKWKPSDLKPLRVWMLEDVVRERRSHLLAKWRTKGGIFLIGYAAFRNLSLGRHAKDRNIASEICHSLQYGPDVLVCDEAHMIKNRKADITLALKQVRTQRRIALTGSPMQNNLMEYYCMVDFVREGFLGSSHEFRNRYQNPIENGQHTNSTAHDVKIMNQRSHILYEQLKGFVQRMDMNVVKKDLPPKTVFVISVKLSPLQRKLYRRFLDVHGFTVDKVSCGRRRSGFFAGYQTLAQIWNHPGLLQLAKEHRNSLKREDAVENFIVDDTSSDENMEQSDINNGEKLRAKNDFTPKLNHEESEWWKDLLDDKIYREVECSGKMVILLDILSMSSEIGDKALVFSQSLTTLDMIEHFLSKLPRKGSEGKNWKQGKDWYRFDGSTDGSERQKLVERFNEPTNTRVKCTLISTRAGSLGINLHAANRVILVDGSWNPTYDLQAIFRVWRYGQKKPVYAYRLLAHGAMEEKIYKRQVTKEGIAARVVDRQQIHRTMSKEEILHLFDFGDEENLDVQQDDSQMKSVLLNQAAKLHCSHQSSLSGSSLSSDKIMGTLLSKHQPRWIANYHEHETLLQENEDERLSKEEQEMAWASFQRSLQWEEVHRVNCEDNNTNPKHSSSTAPVPAPAPALTPALVSSSSSLDAVPLPNPNPQQSKGSSRSHQPAHQRKCSNLDHLLTLRSKGIKSGSSTGCDKCFQEISWENLNRDGRTK